MEQQSGRKITAGIIAALTAVGALGSGMGVGGAIFGAAINAGIVFAAAALIDIVQIKMPKNRNNSSSPPPSSIGNTVRNKPSKNISTDDAPPVTEKWDPPMYSSGYMKGAGWYKDPSGEYDQRFFAGANWTALVMKQGNVMRSDGKQTSVMPSQPAKSVESEPMTSTSTPTPQTRTVQEKTTPTPQTRIVQEKTTPTSITDDLSSLSKMFQDGLLTNEEFTAAKKKLLG